MKESVEKIIEQDSLLAIIVRAYHHHEGIEFFTPNEFSQQLAYMCHSTGKVLVPHVHNPVARQVSYTQETLFIRKGKLRVDFYNAQKQYLESRILEAGDVILLITGGHGFEVLEDVEMIEVKQGPYFEDHDKTRFEGISSETVRLKNRQ